MDAGNACVFCVRFFFSWSQMAELQGTDKERDVVIW